ncbi:unnamed protein product [Moneuplotes crassus]|uniref:Uncharacterized protein n=1 Tax=Euplotes crassus TaxID=5936 RepID=A0AAD1XME6_EUPCR|nr:unnamed protein product [Moneuplotes crassus]
MDPLNAYETHSQPITDEVLEAMKDKGVRTELVHDLREDPGFHKFCNEWIPQRWEPEKDNSMNSDSILIELMQRNIEKMKLPYRRNVDGTFAKNEKDLESEICSKLCQKQRIPMRFFKQSASLSFDMSKRKDSILLKSINNIQLPKCKLLAISCALKHKDIIQNFVSNSFPNEVEHFRLSNTTENQNGWKLISIRCYINSLCSMKPPSVLTLQKFYIPQSQFTSVLLFGAKTSQISFLTCKFCVTSPLKLPESVNFTSKVLDFDGCGSAPAGNWNVNRGDFEDLVSCLKPLKWIIHAIFTKPCRRIKMEILRNQGALHLLKEI